MIKSNILLSVPVPIGTIVCQKGHSEIKQKILSVQASKLLINLSLKTKFLNMTDVTKLYCYESNLPLCCLTLLYNEQIVDPTYDVIHLAQLYL